jgi:hypothetical protein
MTRPETALYESLATEAPPEERLVHLVLKPDWPRALCGAYVGDRLGTTAPGCDRCYECLRIAAARGLGRPGWT